MAEVVDVKAEKRQHGRASRFLASLSIAATLSGCGGALLGFGGGNPKITGSAPAINCNLVSFDPNLLDDQLVTGSDATATQARQIGTQISQTLCETVNPIVGSMVTGYEQHRGNGFGGEISEGKFDMEAGDNDLVDVNFVPDGSKPNLMGLTSVSVTAEDSEDRNNPNKADLATISYDRTTHSFRVSAENQSGDPGWPSLSPVLGQSLDLPQLEAYNAKVQNFATVFAGSAAGGIAEGQLGGL